MSCTLISSIGTGMYKPEGGYRETKYKFQDGTEIKTRIFLDAILQKKGPEIEKIILVGTKTSSWDILIDKDHDCVFWFDVKDQCESVGISDENIKKLEKYVSEKRSKNVVIKVHNQKIDDDTALEIFNVYNSIGDEFNAKTNILFDITHGFRSMPILMYQTLQLVASQNTNIENIELIYGEYIDLEKISYVRNLSQYWKYSQITEALSIFKTKLDGTKLAELIEPYWEAGSKAISNFTGIVQTNYALQFSEVARQIKNAMAKYPESAPIRLGEIKTVLKKILKLYDEHSEARTLLNYSIYLYEHSLNTQAIITLQVCVEVAIAEKYGLPNNLGDYDWWQETGKGRLKEVSSNNQDLRAKLGRLERTRNQIAHGGSKNRDKDGALLGFPSADQLPDKFKSGRKTVEDLLRMLEL